MRLEISYSNYFEWGEECTIVFQAFYFFFGANSTKSFIRRLCRSESHSAQDIRVVINRKHDLDFNYSNRLKLTEDSTFKPRNFGCLNTRVVISAPANSTYTFSLLCRRRYVSPRHCERSEVHVAAIRVRTCSRLAPRVPPLRRVWCFIYLFIFYRDDENRTWTRTETPVACLEVGPVVGTCPPTFLY